MTEAERKQILDISELQIHRYFNHYLTDVFPKQMDIIIEGHNQDAEAHEPRLGPLVATQRQFNRLIWVVVGGSAAISMVIGIATKYGPAIVNAIWP